MATAINYKQGGNFAEVKNYSSFKENTTPKQSIVWRNVLLMSVIHLGGLYGYFVIGLDPTLPWYSVLLPDIFARFGALGIAAGVHRLWSHRAYKARLPLRVFLMICQTIALQDDIYTWCRDHRVHHKHSDTDADPYNARRGFFFSHIGWLLVRKHPEVIAKGKTISLDDVWADPVVRFQRHFYVPLVILLWGLVPTYVFHYMTGLDLFGSFLVAVLFRYMVSLHYAWLVNSAAHLYGYQMYDQHIEPRENRLVIYAAMGEGYHNYHHAFPWDYSASELGWEKNFNISTMFIDACAWLGLAYDRKKVDRSIIERRVMRNGSMHEREEAILETNTVKDYVYGFLFCYWIAIFMFILRYSFNGHF